MTRRTFGSALVALAALATAACYALAFYPGAMSFDGAYQWWQARGGETTNVHAPALTWLWRASDAVSGGPGAVYLLELASFFGGLALIALRLPIRTSRRIAFVVLGGALPICWTLFSAVLSDALLVGVLCTALGLAMTLQRHRGAGRFASVLALLLLTVLLRKNAAPAVLPLALFALWRQFGLSRWRVFGTACVLVAAMQGGSALADRGVDRRGSILPALALWDLAAISIDTGEVLLPPRSHGPGLTVEDLRQAFRSYACSTLFAETKAGIAPAFLGDGDPLLGDIRGAWLRAIVQHPAAYLAHRLRLTAELFGAKPREWPRELVYFAGEFQYRDNPPVAAADNALTRAWLALLERTRDSVALAAWPYLIVSVFAAFLAWRRRADPLALLALAVLASGWAYALPLPLIAASAELRYLGWTCVAAYLGAALALASKTDAASAGLAAVAKSD